MTNLRTDQPQQTQPKQKRNWKKQPGRWSAIDKINHKKLQLLTLDGWTDVKIAEFFDISISGLKSYKERHPKLKATLRGWKDLADSKVEKCLYKRAIGYKYDEITYEKSNVGGLGFVLDKGEIEAIKHTDTAKTKIVTKSVVPDVTAQIFWLKNRQPEQWRDKQEQDRGGDTHHHLTIVNLKETPDQDLINLLLGRGNGKLEQTEPRSAIQN